MVAGNGSAAPPALRNANLYGLLTDVVKRQELNVALITADRVVTYIQLKTAIDNCAAALAARGLKAGQTVNLDFSRPDFSLIVLFAANRIGASVTTFSALEAQMAAPRPELMLSDPGRKANQRGDATLIDNTWFAAREGPRLPAPRPALDGVTLTFGTSGSTGHRKFLAFSEKNLLTRLPLQWSLTGPAERILVTMGGRTAVSTEVHLATLLAGGSAVMVPNDPRHIPYYIDLFGVTSILSTPLLLADLIKLGLPRSVCRTVRQVTISGAAASRDTIERIRRHICDRVVLSYGSTEMCATARFVYDPDTYLPGMVGAPLPGARIEVVDDDRKPVAAGEEGEVRIARDNVLVHRGYLNDPAGSEQRFVDAWFYPGDRASLDAAGNLVIAGRSDGVINAGGNKIALERIEAVIEQHVGSACAVLVGPTVDNHVQIDVVLETSGDVDARDVATFVVAQFSRIRLATAYTTPTLPLTETGKKDRVALAGRLKDAPDAFRRFRAPDPAEVQPHLQVGG